MSGSCKACYRELVIGAAHQENGVRMSKKFLSYGVAALAMGTAVPAAAQDSYRIDANATETIRLQVCSSNTLIRADGDNDTDLDFWLYGPDGSLVTSDTDTTDLFIHRVRRSGSGCEYYRLEVKNLGNVYNQMQVSISGGSSGGSGGNSGTVTNNYRVEANDTDTITITACKPRVDIRVDGDNDTDLDFYLYDQNGNLVYSDSDTTDLMIYTLRSQAGGGRCLDYRLEIRNLGSVYNNYTMTISR